MSRSYKPRKYYRRIVSNSFLKKILECYGDEFYAKNGTDYLNRIVRARLKEKNIERGERIWKSIRIK